MKSALILAAGKGTRMKSHLPKVMQPLLGEPLLDYVMTALAHAHIDDVMVVVGYGAEKVEEFLQKKWPNAKTVLQSEQKGTGHAALMAAQWLQDKDDVVILNGDMPLVTAKEIEAIMDDQLSGALCFATTKLDNPYGYGRVIRGEQVRVVEQKDAVGSELLVNEVNVGIYRGSGSWLVEGLKQLKTDNSQGEYYIVDLITLAQAQGLKVEPVLLPPDNLEGVNDPAQLAELNGLLRDRVVKGLMQSGVKFQDPKGVWISPRTEFKGEAWVGANVSLWGSCKFGLRCKVGAGCQLTDCTFGDDVILQPYVVAENSHAEDGVVLGPFCFLRQETFLSEGSRVGKFVELKNTKVGKGSKVPHLSYLGDAKLGEKVNIGAATVTCNYDGSKKWETEIGDHVFVGSDTMLVAPVRLGHRSKTAAGSVITEDVPDDNVAFGRARQVNKRGKNHKN